MEVINGVKMNFYSHLKDNILDWYKNAQDNKKDVIYCFTCKKSISSIGDHSHHSYVNKNKYYFLEENIFDKVNDELNKYFEKERSRKDNILDCIEKTIAKFHIEIDSLKEQKKQEILNHFEIIGKNIKELVGYYQNIKENLENYFTISSPFYEVPFKNNDLENTIFLINYEILTMTSQQNIKLENEINQISSTLSNYPNRIEKDTENILSDLGQKLGLGTSIEKFDDYYWDINLRINKYLEHINQFKKIVYEIYQNDKNFKKIEEAVNVFDSKLKKGVEFIFNQQFFLENNRNNNTISGNRVQTGIGKRKNVRVRGNSKKRLLNSPLAASDSKQYLVKILKTKSSSNLVDDGNFITLTNDNISFALSPRITDKIKTNSSTSKPTTTRTKSNYDKITLSFRTLQRYFSYSLLDLYNKTFAPTPEERKIFNSNLLLDYKTRYNKLKEYAKPIQNSNKISIYNPILKKLTQVSVPLSKQDHGYAVFPEGCRHILINNLLFITGGVDNMKTPLNIVLCFDVNSKHIIKKPNMIMPHSYHTLEYLDNYECIVAISGENNYYCEIFDLFTCTWHLLPELNYWRSNANVIFNNVTSDIYVLFGMVNNNRNSDIIEVLELKDINGGWIKIDYYKNAQFDFTMNYCKVLQFSKDKLLIYGGNDSRVTKKMYALYLLERNEIVKINDEADLEEIKRAEAGIKISKDNEDRNNLRHGRVKSININRSISSIDTSRNECKTQRTPSSKKLRGRNDLSKDSKAKTLKEDYYI